MSKRALILVEGQTEERFVKDVLYEEYLAKGLYIAPTIITTKRVKNGPNFKGGMTSFSRFESDIKNIFHGAGDALVTTMVDYYGLPTDFPGMDSRPNTTVVDKVEHVENQISNHFENRKNFIPFLALHELESWLFSDKDILPTVMTEPDKKDEFSSIRDLFDTPEDINDNPLTAPSKRILSLFPGYRKTLHGPMALSRIGLDGIRSECPHFDWWLSQLDAFAVKRN